MSDKQLDIAAVNRLCVICTKENGGELLFDRRLKTTTPLHDELHGKAIGFSKEPCEDYQKMLDQAFLFIGFDESKSDMEEGPKGFHRTGHIIGISKEHELSKQCYEFDPKCEKVGFIFVPHVIMHQWGLIKSLDYGTK